MIRILLALRRNMAGNGLHRITVIVMLFRWSFGLKNYTWESDCIYKECLELYLKTLLTSLRCEDVYFIIIKCTFWSTAPRRMDLLDPNRTDDAIQRNEYWHLHSSTSDLKVTTVRMELVVLKILQPCQYSIRKNGMRSHCIISQD